MRCKECGSTLANPTNEMKRKKRCKACLAEFNREKVGRSRARSALKRERLTIMDPEQLLAVVGYYGEEQ